MGPDAGPRGFEGRAEEVWSLLRHEERLECGNNPGEGQKPFWLEETAVAGLGWRGEEQDPELPRPRRRTQ